jgi:hypothetical protein
MIKFKWNLCDFKAEMDNAIEFSNHDDLFTFLKDYCNTKNAIDKPYFMKCDFYITYYGFNETIKPNQVTYGVYSDFDVDLFIEVKSDAFTRKITDKLIGFIFEEYND